MVLASHSKYIGDRQSPFPLFNFEWLKRIVKLKKFQAPKKAIETEIEVKPGRYRNGKSS
jgi:hypothetical protein